MILAQELIRNTPSAIHSGKEFAIPSAQLGTSNNVFAAPADPSAHMPNQRIVCTVTGEDCTRERYHCISKPQVVISPSVRIACCVCLSRCGPSQRLSLPLQPFSTLVSPAAAFLNVCLSHCSPSQCPSDYPPFELWWTALQIIHLSNSLWKEGAPSVQGINTEI